MLLLIILVLVSVLQLALTNGWSLTNSDGRNNGLNDGRAEWMGWDGVRVPGERITMLGEKRVVRVQLYLMFGNGGGGGIRVTKKVEAALCYM